MKHIYNLLISLLLLFFSTFFMFAPEYNGTIHSTPEMEVNFNFAQPKTNMLPDLHLRARYLRNMVERNTKPQFHHKAHLRNTQKSDPIAYADPSSILDHLSTSIRLKRSNILKRFMENDPEIHKSSSKKYSISPTNKEYIAFNSINVDSLETCKGNILQHVIHQEFILLTDVTAHIWSHQPYAKEIKELTAVIGDFITAGLSFNHAGEIKKALTLADAGWALYDCIIAAGEGVVDGITAVVHDITHPIQTAQNFANTAIFCGYYLGIALQEIDSMAISLISGNFDTAHNKYMTWCENFENIAQTLGTYCKKLTSRDAIKTITSSIVQCYATTRALNGFSSIFNNAHNGALYIAKKISKGTQEASLLMSVEGIPLRIAQETLKQIKKIPCAQDKLLQALMQFDGQIIKVGNITCLLDKKGLKHILERHHPKYWDGSLAKIQTFLNKNTSISEVIDIIKKVIKQNRKIILKKGTIGRYQIEGIINNKKYIVGFENGRIGQFYITLKQ